MHAHCEEDDGEVHQYLCLTRRTNRSQITLRGSVTVKSSRPMKNRLWKALSSPRTWSEPMARAAIAAVIVWPGSMGLSEKSEPPDAPAAITVPPELDPLNRKRPTGADT